MYFWRFWLLLFVLEWWVALNGLLKFLLYLSLQRFWFFKIFSSLLSILKHLLYSLSHGVWYLLDWLIKSYWSLRRRYLWLYHSLIFFKLLVSLSKWFICVNSSSLICSKSRWWLYTWLNLLILKDFIHKHCISDTSF